MKRVLKALAFTCALILFCLLNPQHGFSQTVLSPGTYIVPPCPVCPSPTATPTPAPTPTPTPAPTPTPFPIGKYTIGSAYVIDGGFFTSYWGYPPTAYSYPLNDTPSGTNPFQEFNVAVSGAGFTLCNVKATTSTGAQACLSDGGSNGLLDIGQGVDVWDITPNGTGWNIKCERTGKYIGTISSGSKITVPMSATPISVPLIPYGYVPTPTPTPAPTSTPTPGPTPTPIPVAGVMRATDVIDIFGYTTHHGQGHITAAQLQQGLTYTGVRHFRDDGTNNPSLLTDYCNIHAATGATMLMLPWGGDVTDTTGFLDTLASCGALMAVEGQNEANNQPFGYQSSWCDPDNHLGHGNISLGCGQFQRDFNAAKKADPKLAGLAMYAPTEMGDQNVDNAGLQWLTIPTGSGLEMADGTQYADYANVHPYDNCASNPPRDNDAWLMAAPSGAEGGCYDGMQGEFIYQTWRNHFPAYPIGTMLPRVATESGQSTNQISQAIQGKVYTSLVLDAAARGWTHWFVYQMGEEGDGMGAVYDASFAYKLGATYMHNLTTILADSSSAFTPIVLDYSISGASATVHTLLMQKASGVYELAVWAENFSSETSVPVTINLSRTFTSAKIYDITSGTVPVQTLANVSSVPLTLTDHAMIVELQ